LSFVRTCISLEKSQKEFMENSEYNLSRIVQNRIKELMKISQSLDLQAQPSDESPSGDSNV